MKKIIIYIVLVLVTFNVIAQIGDSASALRPKKKNKKAVVTATPTPMATPNPTLEALKKGEPCDSKEDILKKLEEEKKKQKAFTLQGGNTGCSVDKK